MIIGIIRWLTATRETNKITSEQLPCQAKRVQKALLEANKETKESEEFDAAKKTIKQSHTHKMLKETDQCPQTSANTVHPT